MELAHAVIGEITIGTDDTCRFPEVFGVNSDLDHPLLLGGDSGLRGYPIRYQGGDSATRYPDSG